VKLLSLQMTVFTYSRNSGNKRTAVYALPKIPEIMSAERILQYKGLITGALSATQKNYCLGDSKMLSPFIYLYTITTTAISFPAIRERLKLRFRFIKWRYRYQDGLHYYLNENFVRKPILIARNNCTALI
jgi:hypothetical protein